MAPYGSSSTQETAPLLASAYEEHYVDPVMRTMSIVVLTSLAVFALICICEAPFVVPPGMVGVVVTLGHVQSYSNGLHFRAPLVSSVHIMTTKTQLLEEKNVILTKEGLAVTLDTAVLFRLDPSQAASLYQQVGLEYIEILIRPEASSAVRGLTSESEAKALYSSGRTVIQDTLKTELQAKLEPRGIIVEDILLKDISLPNELAKSIEMKVQAEQEAARMEFVLSKERQEAQRKAIEAGGIADFQRIVSEGISAELLKWKGVEATEKFATAPNTKIVIMGNSGSGLPVILSADHEEYENHPLKTKGSV